MIRYVFEFDAQEHFAFEVDEAGWTCGAGDPAADAPPWAGLDRYRCEHCQLPGSAVACPAALALRPVIDAFAGRVSFEEVQVCVETNGKHLRARTSLQEAVRSLVGLLMALSSCPAMMKLRPMAFFHLPFGNPEHTLFRVMGMYLLAQHIREKNGLDGDWEMTGLADLYEKLHVINERMAERITSAAREDATVNGLIILDIFAHSVDRHVQGKLANWRPLFAGYLDGLRAPAVPTS